MKMKWLLAGTCVLGGMLAGEAATYYRIGNDAAGKTSFTGNVDGSVGWALSKSATATVTISDWANSDFINDGRNTRTPPTDTAVTFAGRSLTLLNSGVLMFKKNSNGGDRHVTVNDLRVTSGVGVLLMGQDLSQFTLKGNIALAENVTLQPQFGLATGTDDWRNLVIRSQVTGPASTKIDIIGSGSTAKTQSCQLTLENAANFLGTISSASTTARNFTLVLAGPYGGSLTSLPSETAAVKVNHDGLDPATGLRVLSTTIPTPLLTKLSFFSPTTDLQMAGLKLLTFPKDTVVTPADFTIKAGTSAATSTAKTLKYLGVVTNADETVSLVTTQGPVFYKVGMDPVDHNSFYTNYTASIGWSTTSGATTTTPFSAATFADAECIIDGTLCLRTPTGDTVSTFPAHLLRIRGKRTPSNINIKSQNNAVITIPNLISEDAVIGNGNGGYTYTLAGQVKIVDGSSFSISAVDSGARVMHVRSIIRGEAGTALYVLGGNTGSGTTYFYDLSDFRGELRNTAPNSTIDLVGGFSGTIGELQNTPTLKVNYDGLPAGTGLRVTATAIPATLKTKLRLYSSTTNFKQDGLPLLSFPAGTTVNPAEFSIAYASDATLPATTIPALKVVTGANNAVVLAVDGTAPLYAKYLPNGEGGFTWHFFGEDGSDVTATCGLTAPTAAITVLFENDAQFNALKSITYTAKATRLAAFDAAADTDLTTAPFTFDVQSGAQLDLKGHSVNFPTTFFSGPTSTSMQLIKNSGFDDTSMPVASGQAITATPPSWTTSGAVQFVKNNSGIANKQQNSSVWCYLQNGMNVSQTFTMPRAGRVIVSAQVAAKNWGGSYAVSSGDVQMDGSTIISWGGPGSGTGTSTATVQLAAGAHTLRVRCTKYAIVVDNITVTYTSPGAIVTDTVGGGEAHINVPSGTTVNNAGVQLMGKLKFVKEGAGTFCSARIGQDYSGGNEVKAGKLTTTAGTGKTTDFSANRYPLGAGGSEIVVRSGATLDVAGNYDYFLYHIILDGGILRSGSATDGPVPQTAADWGGIGWMTLTADSTFYLRSDLVFYGGDNRGPIDLGGHTLTVDAPVDSKYVLWRKAITNGVLRLNGVSSAKEYFKICGNVVNAKTVDVVDGMGLFIEQPFNVRGYNPTRTWDKALCTGTAALNVFGTFRPDSPYFYGCTMQDGSTLDLSGKTQTWSVLSAVTVGRKVVDFANDAQVTLKLEGRQPICRQLVDWTDNAPTNLASLAFVLDPVTRKQGYKIYWDEQGIFVRSGTMIFIR